MSAPSAAVEGHGKCHSLLSNGLAWLSACEPRACKPRCVQAPCALSRHTLCLEVPSAPCPCAVPFRCENRH